jgi:hypothetical protein
VPSRRVLGRAVKANLDRAIEAESDSGAWPAEPSRELMVLGCQYLAGRSGQGTRAPCSASRSDLGSLHTLQAGQIWVRSVLCRQVQSAGQVAVSCQRRVELAAGRAAVVGRGNGQLSGFSQVVPACGKGHNEARAPLSLD